MFPTNRFENSPAAPVAVLELPGDPPRFVPLQRTTLSGILAGPIAALRVTHTYRFSRAQHSGVVEAVYRFPLPGDAAVNGVSVRFGEVEIVAELAERSQGERQYREAVEQGRQAALLTRESPDVFTLQVAGIPPDVEVTVTTRYVQVARREGDGWSLRIPLTTSPRYVRGDEAASRHAKGQPLAIFRDPGHRFELDLLLTGSVEASSPTHSLEQSPDPQGVRLRLGDVLPDRDCLIRWSSPGRALEILSHDESDRTYFLALATPPEGGHNGQRPREVILLVDHSGSMEGPKWIAADWAVETFLTRLAEEPGERPTFALGLFHNTTRWFAPAPQPATAENVQRAIAFLKGARDSGGTELGIALEQALRLPRDNHRAAHVIAITDAEVTDAARILRLASDEAARDDRRRISVLCIDAAPNSFLANELADRGGGVSRFLTSDPDAEDISSALDDVLEFWTGPVMTGLKLAINRPVVELAAGGAVAGRDWTEIDLGEARSGRPVLVLGRVARGDALTARLLGPDGTIAEATAMSVGIPGLKAVFGARRVNGLEFLIGSGLEGKQLNDQLARLGYDAATVSAGGTVYHENAVAEAEKALKGLLMREALAYGLPSAETSFVAVRREAGQPVDTRVAVGNALPSGWSGEFLTRPGGPMLAQPLAAPMSTGAMPRILFQADPISDTAMIAPAAMPAPPREAIVFHGTPPAGSNAVLFDSSRDRAGLPEAATLTRLAVRGGIRPSGRVMLEIYAGDRSAPRARVRLADVLRVGSRPLNLAYRKGEAVVLMLSDPRGELVGHSFEIALGWD